jgi:hypothetical protein
VLKQNHDTAELAQENSGRYNYVMAIFLVGEFSESFRLYVLPLCTNCLEIF